MSKNDKVELHVADVLRADIVKRWQIVGVDRGQSLAEHTYGVVVLTMALCHRMQVDKEVARTAAIMAVLHDIPEVVTGDIPTPVKKVMGVDANLKLINIESRLNFCGVNYYEYGQWCPEAQRIVKMADLLESCWFLHNHGSRHRHSEAVYNKLVVRLGKCPEAWQLWQEMLEHTPAEIDEIV